MLPPLIRRHAAVAAAADGYAMMLLRHDAFERL